MQSYNFNEIRSNQQGYTIKPCNTVLASTPLRQDRTLLHMEYSEVLAEVRWSVLRLNLNETATIKLRKVL